jgi:hypothetical protein
MDKHYRFVSHKDLKSVLHAVCTEFRALENLTLLDPLMEEDPPKSSIWLGMLAVHKYGYLPNVVAHWMGCQVDYDMDDYEDWEEDRIADYVIDFNRFARAFKNARKIRLLVLEDFVSSAQQITTSIESTFNMPDGWETNLSPEEVGQFRRLHQKTLQKTELYIGAMFITEKGKNRIQNLCECLGLSVTFAGASVVVPTLEDTIAHDRWSLASREAINNPDLTTLLGGEQNMWRELKKPLMTFTHKFPDDASIALRWLLKLSFPQIWQGTSVAPYKDVTGQLAITSETAFDMIGGQEYDYEEQQQWVEIMLGY